MDKYGAFNNRISQVQDISLSDLDNLYNVFEVLRLPDKEILEWLQANKLIRKDYFCDKCNSFCYLGAKKERPFGKLFR